MDNHIKFKKQTFSQYNLILKKTKINIFKLILFFLYKIKATTWANVIFKYKYESPARTISVYKNSERIHHNV